MTETDTSRERGRERKIDRQIDRQQELLAGRDYIFSLVHGIGLSLQLVLNKCFLVSDGMNGVSV